MTIRTLGVEIVLRNVVCEARPEAEACRVDPMAAGDSIAFSLLLSRCRRRLDLLTTEFLVPQVEQYIPTSGRT